VLDEPIGRSGALRPAPEKQGGIVVNDNILRMIRDQISDVGMLQIWNGFIIMNVFQFVGDATLTLEVKTTCVETTVMYKI